jgi:hypothetical protein
MRRLPYHDADGNGPNMTVFKNNEILWYTDATNSDTPLRPSPMPGVLNVDSLINEAWAKDPDRRPTAAEIRDRLARALIDYPSSDYA